MSQTTLPPFTQPQKAVQRIGLGLAALGRPGYINLGHAQDLSHDYSIEAMQARAFAVLDEAWRQGIRYYDTARSYGRGEEFLGNWLRERRIPTAEVAIGSKWGYTYTADWQVQATHHEIKEHRLPILVRQWQETQQTLGAYLDVYQIHSATLESGVLDNVEVLTHLSSLKANGIKIGLSVSGRQQAAVIQKAISTSIDGNQLFDTVQATYNLLETSAGPALAEAHRAGLGIIVKEALANGRLTPRNNREQFSSQHALLQKEADQQAVGIDALAIAGVLAQPWVDVVLSGVATIEHLQANLKALTVKWNEDLTERFSLIQESPQVYWSTRKTLEWN